MNYETTTPLVVSPAEALERIGSTLEASNFRMEESNDAGLVAVGPGLKSNHENPLRGARAVRVEVRNGQLHLIADLGAVETFFRWTIRFVMFAAILLALVLGWMFARRGPFWVAGAVLFPLLPWPFILPFMERWMLTRTKRALDALLSNSAA